MYSLARLFSEKAELSSEVQLIALHEADDSMRKSYGTSICDETASQSAALRAQTASQLAESASQSARRALPARYAARQRAPWPPAEPACPAGGRPAVSSQRSSRLGRADVCAHPRTGLLHSHGPRTWGAVHRDAEAKGMQRRGLGLQRHHVPRLVCRPHLQSVLRS